MSSKRIESNFELFRTIVAVLIALGLGFIVILIISDDPWNALQSLIIGPMTSTRRMGNIIELMIPYLFTGTAICIMFQANQFNMIAEGAFMFSACMATWFATSTVSVIFGKLGIFSGILFPIAVFLFGGLIGMVCAFIPAILKIKWRANEVVSSIMLNTILMQLSNYMLKNVIVDAELGFTASYELPTYARMLQFVPGTRIHTGLFVAIAVVLFAYFFIYRTRWGYQIRVVGQNQNFARYSGISIVTVILMSQLMGGFFAGMGGTIEVQGMYSRYQWVALTGHGFDGMLVGILAKNNPLFVPVAALLLAYLRAGADVMGRSSDVPLELIQVIQALIILLVAAQLLLSGLKHRLIVRNATKEAKVEKEVA